MASKSRTWTCQKQAAGVKCGAKNPKRYQKCQACGKRRPQSKQPAHMAALERTYEQYAELNGSERCGICGAPQKAGGKRLHRDHDHRRNVARGLLCFRCNAALRPYMTLKWLRSAVAYIERTHADV